MTTPLYWLLVERSNTIDKGWVEGVRKAWKAWFTRAKSLRPYDVRDGVDFSAEWEPDRRHQSGYPIIQKEAARVVPLLEQGKAFVERLRSDLLINKALWTSGAEGKTGDPRIAEIKEKILKHLDDAAEEISDAKQHVDAVLEMADPSRAPLFHADWYESLRMFQLAVNSPAVRVKEAAEKADSEISGKLFRHLTKVIQMAGGTIDFGQHEPDELSIGKMKIVFLDTPMSDIERHKFKGQGRDPYARKAYIRELKSAYALLARQKLSFLWTGLLYIRPKTLAPQNHLGVQFGVGGTYHRNGDYITVYHDPVRGLDELIIHELGHRYYYKYLSPEDRRKFDKWFGKVAAVSTYGETVAPEDFAEVFAYFVLGRDLSRDQIDRFKIVLGRTRRMESLLGQLKKLL